MKTVISTSPRPVVRSSSAARAKRTGRGSTSLRRPWEPKPYRARRRASQFSISPSRRNRRAFRHPSAGTDGDSGDPQTRMLVFIGVCLALALVIVARLWYLQILDFDRFEAASTENKERILRSEAPRGRILATDGRTVMVDNNMSLSVGIDRTQLPADKTDEVVESLSVLLNEPKDALRKRLDRPKDITVDAIPVADDVAPEALVRIKERQEEFPGVVALTRPKRIFRYPGDCPPRDAPCRIPAPHVFGYVGETNEEDLKTTDSAYRRGDTIGRAGVESAYEKDLRGEPGERIVLVNNLGRQIDIVSERDPVQGNDVVVTIDPEIQKITEEALERGILAARSRVDRRNTGIPYRAGAGAAIVMDPNNGEIVAMASYPTYDPAEFTGGIATERWKFFQDPANNLPLLNRAIAGQYAPASTFKVVTAMSALANGFVDRNTTYNSKGFYVAGRDQRRFRDWKEGGHGVTNMRKSLVESVDTYYYWIGENMYNRRNERWFLQETARLAGLGQRTGLDLPGEKAGRVPDENWARAMNNANPVAFPNPIWRPGDNILSTIGQGDMLTTPLQMATVYAAIANGGTLWRPHVVKSVQRPDGSVVRTVPPEKTGDLPLDPELTRLMAEDLVGAVDGGTADAAFRGYPMERGRVAGKTGTGEVAGKQNTSWFVGWAPTDAPRYVVAVVVEEGGNGGATAAPITRLIYERIFGIPTTGLKQGAVTD
jgi:penicillin-binding protein 2